MIGLVLAAGAGRRLRPDTDVLPKTLMTLDAQRTVLDTILANLVAVGLREVAIVVGHGADAIRRRQSEFERRHRVSLHLIDNDKAAEWNNAYSLWCARQLFSRGVLLVNGDTVHPVSVEQTLLAHRGPRVLLAVDTAKRLAAEEMKVVWDQKEGLRRITKIMDPTDAVGKYIGVSLIEPEAAEDLTEALHLTWTRDPQLYYEDGYQQMADIGQRVDVCFIAPVEWVEIDDHADLARAREIAQRWS